MMIAPVNRTPKALALPDVATLLVVFLIYTNLAVLGVHFHQMPAVVAIMVPAMLLIPLMYYVLVRREKIVMPAATPWLVLLMSVMMISTLLSKNVPAAFSELTVYLTEGLALYILLVNVIRSSKMLRLVIWALLAAGIVLGGVPLYQQLTGDFNNEYGGLGQTSQASFRTGDESLQGDVRQPRLAGAIGEMNRFAQVMLMLVPLGMFRFYSETSRLLRLIALLSAALAGIGMILAFSRGAAVAFVLLVLVTALLMAALPQYSTRLISMQSITAFLNGDSSGGDENNLDGAIRGRATVMLAAAMVYADHPLVGVGPGMFSHYAREYSLDIGLRYITGDREAHSLYLGLAAESGTLGLFFFFTMLAATFRDLLRVRSASQGRRPDLESIANSFMLALLAYLATGLFLHLAYMRYFWLMFALASAAGFVGKQELGLLAHPHANTAVAYERISQ
jgi:hypothetical protein